MLRRAGDACPLVSSSHMMAGAGKGSRPARLRPDKDAGGSPHTTFDRDRRDGRIKIYRKWITNPNPEYRNHMMLRKRFRRYGPPHDKVNPPLIIVPGRIARPAQPWEILL